MTEANLPCGASWLFDIDGADGIWQVSATSGGTTRAMEPTGEPAFLDMNTPNQPKDEVYREAQATVADFQFGAKVAAVFDDMLDRSVPFYREIQRMIAEMASDFVVPGTNVYDLGCSTGNTLLQLHPHVDRRARFIGVDYSADMLQQCRQKLAAHGFDRPHELIQADLNQGVALDNASLVLMILTLQFVRPLYRDKLIRQILESLVENGALILVEKVIGEDSLFNRLFIKYYYEMKKSHGYTELEIAQKREALENVLIPYKLMENREMLLRAGFRYCDVFFKWYNFCGMIAVR
jgi:tRNA (cmo5U34)-methyltransferase